MTLHLIRYDFYLLGIGVVAFSALVAPVGVSLIDPFIAVALMEDELVGATSAPTKTNPSTITST